MKKAICFPLPIVALFVGMLVLPVAASAQTTQWTGATSANWNTAGNWSLGIPGATNTVLFSTGSGSAANLATNNDIPGGATILGISNTVAPAGDISISGNPLTIGSSGIVFGIGGSGATRSLAINTNITLSAPQIWSIGGTPATNKLTIGANSANTVDLNGQALTLKWNTVAGQTMELNSTISGTTAVTLQQIGNGKALMRFKADNTYSGGTTIHQGGEVVQLGSSTVLSGPTIVSGPLGTGLITFSNVNAGGVPSLEAYGADRVIDNNISLTFSGTSTGNSVNIITSPGETNRKLTIYGTITSLLGNRTITTDASTATGSGDLVLNGNLVLGTAGQAGGTFTLGQSGGAPAAQGGKIFVNGNILETAGVTTGVQLIVPNGSAALPTRLQLNGQNTYSGGTMFSANGGLIDVGSSSTFSGPTLVSGPLGTGALTISVSTTRPAIQAIGGPRTIGNSVVLSSNFEIKGTENLAISGSVTNSGANRSLFSSNAGTTTLSGPIYLSDASATGRTLTFSGVSTNNPVFTVSGNIANFNGGPGTAGNVTIGSTTIASAATVTLSGANTHSGNTTLNTASTLNIGSAGAFGTSAFVIGGNGSFDNTTGGALVLSTNMNQSGGSPTFIGTNDLTLGNVALSGAPTRTITVSAKTLTVGNVSETGATNFAKAGAGKLVITGTGSYTGTTTINAGTLQVNGSITSTAAVSVNNGGTLAGSGAVSGPVTINGGGTLAPGESIDSLDVGALTFNVDVNGGSTFAVELNTNLPLPIADLVNANGSLSIAAGAILSLVDLGNTYIGGKKLTLISYAGTWDNGIFLGHPDDSLVTVGVNAYKINYNDTSGGANFGGGSYGNYVTMTAVPEASAILFGGIVCFILGAAHVGRKLRSRTAAA